MGKEESSVKIVELKTEWDRLAEFRLYEGPLWGRGEYVEVEI